MLRVCLAAAIAAGSLVVAVPAKAVTFAFDGVVGTRTGFSLTDGGLTASFSSPGSAGMFAVVEPFGVFSYPVVLANLDSFGGDSLVISFSSPVTDSITLPFGIYSAFATAPATLTAQDNTGTSVTFTTTSYNGDSGSPEGIATFVPTGQITSLTLTSDSAFGIASLSLTPASTTVPEPASAALLGLGLAGLASVRAAARRGWRTPPSV